MKAYHPADIPSTAKQPDHTRELQKRIDDQAARGGGTVTLESGTYYSTTLFLRDRVTLHLEAGAVLYGLHKPEAYYDARRDRGKYGHFQFFRALIWAQNCTHCGITGQGRIDGQGYLFEGELSTEGEGIRPKLVWFDACQHVRIENVELVNSAAWTLHCSRCTHVKIGGVTLRAHTNVNNDGMDIDSCSWVSIHDCDIDSEDDAICLKTQHDIPCENIVIRGCRLRSRCYGIRCGLESVADFRNITVSDCIFHSSDRPALGVHLIDGGSVHNMVCNNLIMDGVELALHLSSSNEESRVLGKYLRIHFDGQAVPPAQRGSVHGLIISNVIAHCTPGPAIFIENDGDKAMSGIVLRNWQLHSDGVVQPREINAHSYRSRGSVRNQGPPDKPYLLEPDKSWGKWGWFWAQKLCARHHLDALPDAAVIIDGAAQCRLEGFESHDPIRPRFRMARLQNPEKENWPDPASP